MGLVDFFQNFLGLALWVLTEPLFNRVCNPLNRCLLMAKMVDPHTAVVVMYGSDGESGHTGEICCMYTPRTALSSTLSGEAALVRLHRLYLKVAGDGSVADGPAAAHNVWKLLPHCELKLRAHNHGP